MNGILLIDKPQGFTSHDVVAKLRGALHERRIGHAGTLDPMATGLLVVFVGRATRAVEFAESAQKEYIAGLRLGLTTDTQDITGQTLTTENVDVSHETLHAALKEFTGEIEQIPPMYSAIKIGGKKLYEIAREGGEIERKPRKVTISSLEFLGMQEVDIMLRISCSKGTYIRTLCHDIGQKLGCGGCMSSLRRTRAGEFGVERAHSIRTVEEAARDSEVEELLLPVDWLFASMPKLTINEWQEKKCRVGNEFPVAEEDGKYRVYSENGDFLMLATAKDGTMKTIKSFFEV